MGKTVKTEQGTNSFFVQVAYFLDYLGCGVETPHGGFFIQSTLQLLHSAPKQRMTWFEGSKTDMTDERQKMTQTQTNRQVNKHTHTQTHADTHTHTQVLRLLRNDLSCARGCRRLL